MKKILKGQAWSPSWILAALLLAGLSLGYAWMSYQSFTAWKSPVSYTHLTLPTILLV